MACPLNHRILLSSGEFIKRKNHETALRAIAKIVSEFPDIHYVICGHGQLQDYLQQLVKDLGLENHVSFPGYRQDILEIYPCADIFVFPSFQEGLPMALLEAHGPADFRCLLRYPWQPRSDGTRSPGISQIVNPQSAGLQPCKGGYMISKANDVNAYAEAIAQILRNPVSMDSMKQANALRARQFSREQVSARMEKIYQRISHKK